MSDDRPIGRRGFFREGLRGLLGKAIDAMRPIEEAARRFSDLETHAARAQAPAMPSSITAPVASHLVAQWQEGHCLRPAGSECQMCVDHCPEGEAAIRVEDRRIIVVEAGCIGCDACMEQCPTDPKSMMLVPRRPGGTPTPSNQ